MDKKWVVGGIVAAAAGLTLIKGSQLSNLAKEFVIESSARIHSVTAAELVLAIDLVFKNPTDGEISLKHPTIALFDSQGALSRNEPTSTSEISAQTYTIKANSQTKLAPVYLKIPYLTLLQKAYAWVPLYLRGEPIALIGRATTTVNGFRVEKLLPVPFQKNPPVGLTLAAASYSATEGVRVRMNLTGSNTRNSAITVTSRLAIYATESDRLVDAPLWTLSDPTPLTLAANKKATIKLINGQIKATQLAAYKGLASVLVVATVQVGSRSAQSIITLALPQPAQ